MYIGLQTEELGYYKVRSYKTQGQKDCDIILRRREETLARIDEEKEDEEGKS